MELLGLFASQAAIALDLLQILRGVRAAAPPSRATPTRSRSPPVAESLERLDGPRRDAGLALLDALARVLR